MLRSLTPCLFCVLLLPLFGLAGCDVAERPKLRPSLASQQQAASENRRDKVEILEPPSGAFEGAWEAWDAYYAGRQPMGYSHVQAGMMEENHRQRRVRYTTKNKLLIRQGNARILQSLEQSSTESSDGRLVDFHAVLRVGPAVTRFEGEVVEDQLQISIIRGTSRPRRTIPWQTTYRGPVALEQSLRRQPLTQEDERRSLKMLLPGKYELGTARLRCRGVASIPTLDGSAREAIEIDCEFQQQDGRPTFSTLWTSDDGQIVRSLSPSLSLTAYRTDAAVIDKFADEYSAPISLAIEGEWQDVDQANRVAFRVRPIAAVEPSDPAIVIPPAPGQYVRTLDDGTQHVLVTRTDHANGNGWSKQGFKADTPTTTESDLESNFFVDADAGLIRQLAEAALGSRELTDHEIAVEMAQTVDRIVASETDVNGLVKASVVAQRSASDSTGRAIMLAALLRTRQIPARVAFGLRLADEQDARMLYHAWTLAWIDDRWVALDAADQGVAAPDRITLSSTDLDSGNEYEAMLPLLDTVGRIEVKVTGRQ